MKIHLPQSLLILAVTAAGTHCAFGQVLSLTDDTWVREDSADSNRNGNDQMNVRTDLDGDDNDLILLRFDTSTLAASAITSTLTLTWQRSDSGTGNTMSLYGINETDPDETLWSESTVTYNNAPGLLPDGVDPTTELGLGNSFDDIRDLDLANLTLLVGGQDYGPQTLDTTYSFTSTELTDFINADTNGEVSFLILRGNESTSGNQARFWPKEFGTGATLDATAVPEPSTLSILAGLGVALVFVRRRR